MLPALLGRQPPRPAASKNDDPRGGSVLAGRRIEDDEAIPPPPPLHPSRQPPINAAPTMTTTTTTTAPSSSSLRQGRPSRHNGSREGGPSTTAAVAPSTTLNNNNRRPSAPPSSPPPPIIQSAKKEPSRAAPANAYSVAHTASAPPRAPSVAEVVVPRQDATSTTRSLDGGATRRPPPPPAVVTMTTQARDTTTQTVAPGGMAVPLITGGVALQQRHPPSSKAVVAQPPGAPTTTAARGVAGSLGKHLHDSAQCVVQKPTKHYSALSLSFPLPLTRPLGPAVASYVVSWLEALMQRSAAAPSGEPPSPPLAACRYSESLSVQTPPLITLFDYVTLLQRQMKLTPWMLAVACSLVERVTAASVAHRHTEGAPCPHNVSAVPLTVLNVHRLVFAACVITEKCHDDEYHSQHFYGSIVGMPLWYVRELEIIFMSILNWDPRPDATEACRAMHRMAARALYTPPPHPTTRDSSPSPKAQQPLDALPHPHDDDRDDNGPWKSQQQRQRWNERQQLQHDSPPPPIVGGVAAEREASTAVVMPPVSPPCPPPGGHLTHQHGGVLLLFSSSSASF